MKKKIIISALALTIGAGLAGSITGTAAWYQYSTKVTGAYVGASGGASGNLNIRIRKDGQAADEGWTGGHIAKEVIQQYVQSQGYGKNIQPVTPGALEKDSAMPASLYANPVPGRAAYENWKLATTANYIVIPLQLRKVENNGSPSNVADEVYLSELRLEQRITDPETADISSALRFHISAYDSANPSQKTNRLISKVGGTTVTNGKLDLDGDGKNDTVNPNASDKYGWENDYSSLEEIVYGAGSQVSYSAEQLDAPATGRQYYDNTNTLVADGDVYSMIAKTREGKNGDDLVDGDNLTYDGTNSRAIGSTVAGTSSFLNVDITIWVEGWQKFPQTSGGSSFSSIWNKNYINAAFNIGFEFALNAEIDA